MRSTDTQSRQGLGANARVKLAAIEPGIQIVNQIFTAVVKREADCWIGWVEEIPGVNCQESTREELLASLRITLAEALELNRQEAIGAAGSEFEELPIAV